MPLLIPVLLAALLFGIGVYGVLARRNAILVLMAVELMLNAVNLNLVAFDVVAARRAARRPGVHAVRHHHRRRRDRARPGDRAAGLPQPRAPRRRRAARAADRSREPPTRARTPRDRRSTSRVAGAVRWPPSSACFARPALAAARRCRSRSPAPRVALVAALGARPRARSPTAPLRRRRQLAHRSPTGAVDHRASTCGSTASPRSCRVAVAVVALAVQVYSVGYLRGRPALPVVRRARLAVHRRDAAGRRRRRPVRAAGRLGGHGRLLLLPDRPPLGAAGGAAPPRSRRSWSPGSATSASCSASSRSAVAAGTFRISERPDGAVAAALTEHTATVATLLLLCGVVGQVGAVPAAHLAARRDGRPDADLRADPRRHHGRRRHLPGRPALPAVPAAPDDAGRARRDRLRSPCSARRLRRARAGRHQAGARLLDGQPARLHAGALAVGVRDRRDCSTCSPTPRSRRCCSSPPAR